MTLTRMPRFVSSTVAGDAAGTLDCGVPVPEISRLVGCTFGKTFCIPSVNSTTWRRLVSLPSALIALCRPAPIAVRLDDVVCRLRRSVTTVGAVGPSGAKGTLFGSGSVVTSVRKYVTPMASCGAPTSDQSWTKISADSFNTWSRVAQPGHASASMLPERSSTSATVARAGTGTIGRSVPVHGAATVGMR